MKLSVLNRASPDEMAETLRHRQHIGGDSSRLVGPKIRCLDLADAHSRVREIWPDAYKSGSVCCWFWWTGTRSDASIVAEAWIGRLPPGQWWLRVRSPSDLRS